MRHYDDTDREAAKRARLGKIADIKHDEPRPAERQPGESIHRLNGQELIVKLLPWGRCTQYRAVFPDGAEIKGGMDEIHTEIRRRMPPLRGI